MRNEQLDLQERRNLQKQFESNLSQISSKFIEDDDTSDLIIKQFKPPRAPQSQLCMQQTNMTAYLRKCSGTKCTTRKDNSLHSSRTSKVTDMSTLSARLKISTRNAYSDPESDENLENKNVNWINPL